MKISNFDIPKALVVLLGLTSISIILGLAGILSKFYPLASFLVFVIGCASLVILTAVYHTKYANLL